MTLYIYKIFFDEEPNVVYIGKTKDPNKRKWFHSNIKQNNKKTKKNNWLLSRFERGWDLQFEVIEQAETEEEINQKEIHWIAFYRADENYTVKNSTEGGEGIANPDQSVRDKIAKSRKGRKLSEETKKRIGDAGRGRKASEKTRQLLSEQRTGEKHPRAVYTYELTSPEGTTHVTGCLSTFCREHGISPSNMCNVIKGKLPATKGWTGRKVESPTS